MSTKTFRFHKVYDYVPWHDNKCIAKIEMPFELPDIFEDMSFKEMVTIGCAIHNLETFLSQKVTQDYLDTHPELLKAYTEYYTEYDKPNILGDFMSGYTFIEDVYLRNNVATLVLGS